MARKAIGYLTSADPLLMQPQYPIFTDGTHVGRDADTCEIIVASDFVSRQHCAITPENGALVLEDNRATNGTFVNGQKITRHNLSEGDAISCGRPSPPHFVYTARPRTNERTFILPLQSAYRIGRALDNDLPLADDPTVSSRHARLSINRGAITIQDLGSANGTFVNGERVSSRSISPTDVVSIGSTELLVEPTEAELRITAREKRNQVKLEAVNLRREHRGHVLLNNISLVIEPGAFVGVLGPSGAGKSTLLNALNGFLPANSGEVLLNEMSLYRSYDMLKNSIGYVPQDDIIHKELTVERSLLYTAQLRLPKDYTEENLGQHVTSVIETLGLNHVRQNFVTQLSGGQRKRVSIGCELLTRPSLVFLDEPTSGLDPSTEEKLMHHFRRMAEQGQTVILTTHILYSLDLLDLVILLSRGRLVYYGPVSEVCPFFSSPGKPIQRPIEIFDLLEPETADPKMREERADFYEKKYRESPLYETYIRARSAHANEAANAVQVQDSPPRRRLGRSLSGVLNPRQFAILVRRMFDLKLSFPSRLLIPLLTPLILGILTSTIQIGDYKEREALRESFEQEHAAGLQLLGQTGLLTGEEFLELRYEGFPNLPVPLSLPLLMVMTAVFLGTLSACLEISGERSIYQRERSVNLSIPMYVASKLPALFMLAAVQCFIYILTTVVFLGMWDADILSLVLIAIGVAWVSCTIGLLISSLDPTGGQNSVVLAVIAVLPQLLFSGAMEPNFYGGMNTATQTIASVFPARWGFELMLTALYQEPEWVRDLITRTENGIGFRFGSEVYWLNALALSTLGAVYYTATCISLKRYDRL